VRTNEAIRFVAASMPKETPQATETANVMSIRDIVLKVYKGRFLISGYRTKDMISQVKTKRTASPNMKLSRYFRNVHSPA